MHTEGAPTIYRIMIQIEVICTTNFEFKHGSGAFLRFVKVVLYFVFILSAQLALGRFEVDGLRLHAGSGASYVMHKTFCR